VRKLPTEKHILNDVETMLQVTHLVTPGRAGGLERVVAMLALGHAARGHRVDVIAVLAGAAPEPPLLGTLRRGGVSVSVVRSGARAYAQERRALRALLEPRERGIVHSHGYRADVLFAPVARTLGYATVTTLHGFTGGDVKNRLYEFLQRRAARRFDRVAAVSRPIADAMRRGRNAERVVLLPNAYSGGGPSADRSEARARLGLQANGFVVGWVGRLSHEKAADVLVAALAHAKDLPITIAVIGDGPDAERLRVMAEALQVSAMVRWLGPVDDASELFRAFDLFVLSSRTEGTPIVLFEAMAASVPIVATAVGGVPDVVTAREATLVPPDSPQALAAAIRDVVSGGAEAVQRAANASTVLATRFAPARWLDAYEAIYQDALRAAGHPHPRQNVAIPVSGS
jgi:glycosyltransferase involved in cell wall biosynthesis